MMHLTKQQKKDFKQCEAVIKKHSKTFYKAFSMLGSLQDRQAIYAIYAYCRVVDDAIDEYKDIELLESYQIKLDNLKKGRTPDDFIFRSLKLVIDYYYPTDYDFKPYYGLIRGQKKDFIFTQPQTLDSLLDYCYDVAGVVGEMLSYILAPKSSVEALKYVAIDLGEAMQLTNILRDIGEDLKRQRIYIPQALMEKHQYSENDLKAGIINDQFKVLFDELASYAHKKYQKGLNKISLFKPDARKPLILATKLYEAILYTIVENGYDVFSKRNVVSNKDKKDIITKVYDAK